MQETQSRLDPTSSRARGMLGLASVITIALYLIPSGYYIIYPLMLFSTYAHEMGHGITAWLMGGEFVEFEMWSDGSGVARHRGRYSNLELAMVSAGGLLGPAILGAIFFVLSKRAGAARIALGVFSVLSVLAVILVVRGSFGIGFVLASAAVFGAVAAFAPKEMAQLVMLFVAVQMSLSVFSRGDYLFMEYAQTGSGRMPSDVTQISNALFGPYWLWGALVGAASVAAILFGFWVFFMRGSSEDPDPRRKTSADAD